MVTREGCLVQQGPFGSIWVRQYDASTPVAALLAEAERAVENLQKVKPKLRMGLYVAMLESAAGGIAELRRAGFDWYCYHDEREQRVPQSVREQLSDAQQAELMRPPMAEFVYKRWVGGPPDQIPAYATSIEGAGGLIFSPAVGNDPYAPGDELLVVWEHKSWRLVSGAVNPGELTIETLRREIGEEVNLKLDDSFQPLYLGGWQAVRARDGAINDNFSVFALRAASKDIALDNLEVSEAMWVPWRPLLEHWRIQGGPASGKLKVDVQDPKMKALFKRHDRLEVANNVMAALEIFAEGRGLECMSNVDKNQTLQLRIGANADTTPGVTFVVDCGSKHTSLHVLRSGREPGTAIQLHEIRLRPAGQSNVALGKDVLLPAETAKPTESAWPRSWQMWSGGATAAADGRDAETIFDEFLNLLNSGLVECGKRDGDSAAVMIGATGGVRKLLEEGQVSQATLDRFGASLQRRLGDKVRFEVLDGDREAACELRAARCIFAAEFAKKNHARVDLLSGGGASCQFAYGTEGKVLSIMLPTDEAQKRLQKTPDEDDAQLREAADQMVASYTARLRDAALPTFSGAFVGATAHQDVANLGGFELRFLQPAEALELIEQLLSELIERRGASWDRALDRWGDTATSKWVIVAASALRLKALLSTAFDENAVLYFARRAPAEISGGRFLPWRDAAQLEVSWPVGMKLLLDDAEHEQQVQEREKSKGSVSA